MGRRRNIDEAGFLLDCDGNRVYAMPLNMREERHVPHSPVTVVDTFVQKRNEGPELASWNIAVKKVEDLIAGGTPDIEASERAAAELLSYNNSAHVGRLPDIFSRQEKTEQLITDLASASSWVPNTSFAIKVNNIAYTDGTLYILEGEEVLVEVTDHTDALAPIAAGVSNKPNVVSLETDGQTSKLKMKTVGEASVKVFHPTNSAISITVKVVVKNAKYGELFGNVATTP